MEYDVNFFKVSPREINPERGMALVAEPGLSDLYFKRSVVLLAEHNEDRSVGFVLNKLLDISISDMIDDFPEIESNIMMGGPVAADSLHFIHTLGELIPDAMHICHSVYWGGDFETLKQLFRANKIDDSQVKFFIGHAGWTSGQLLDELLQDSWVLVNLNEEDIMGSDANLWKKTVIQLGETYKTWMNYPENPHLN